MTANRSTFLLLLAAASLALGAGPTWAEPVETPPEAPPAGAAEEMPEAPPAAEPVVERMKAQPGRLPDTNGPKIPSVIGRMPQEANPALSTWRLRVENVVTDRAYVGRVVDQHPDAGSTLAPGEVITLVVGIATLPGRGYTCVPPIEDLQLEAGVAALRKQGFDITLRTAESYDGDKGVILAQAPRPASVAPRGSKVIVVVGKGGLGEPPVVEETPVPLPAPAEDVPPAGPSVVPEGPPVVEEPPMPAPPAEEPPMPEPPAEEPVAPTVPVEPPPAEEPPTPPMEEPVPPAEEPPLPVVEDPPAPPAPIEPPKPRVMLRVPTLVGPAAGESYPRAFGSTFTWGTIRGAEAYEWELQVEGEDGTWTTALNETVEGTSHRPQRMEAGRYRWRVRAVAGDVQGDWSKFRRLFLY